MSGPLTDCQNFLDARPKDRIFFSKGKEHLRGCLGRQRGTAVPARGILNPRCYLFFNNLRCTSSQNLASIPSDPFSNAMPARPRSVQTRSKSNSTYWKSLRRSAPLGRSRSSILSWLSIAGSWAVAGLATDNPDTSVVISNSVDGNLEISLANKACELLSPLDQNEAITREKIV